MERTGDRPLREAGGLAHLGSLEPLRPRGREGRQDLLLTTGWPGGRYGLWDPGPRLGVRRHGHSLELGRGFQRVLGECGWHMGVVGLACFEPFHRRNAKRFRTGKCRAVALLAELRSKRVY